MIKEVTVKGMTCPHCGERVEKAFSSSENISAKANIYKGIVALISKADIGDKMIYDTINDLGFEVTSIKIVQGQT